MVRRAVRDGAPGQRVAAVADHGATAAGPARSAAGSATSGCHPTGFGVGQLIVLLTSTLDRGGGDGRAQPVARISSTAALAISVLLAVMALWYYRLYVAAPVAAGYGL